MSYGKNWGDAGDLTSLHNAAVSSDSQSTGVDVSAYDGQVAIVLGAINTAGTTPTLAVKVQESDSSGSGYTDVTGGGFAAIDNTGGIQKIVLNADALKKYIRLDFDIGGTSSPAFGVSAAIIGPKKVND